MAEHVLDGVALVTGASRGIATAFSRAGAQVVWGGRDRGRLAELRRELGDSFTVVAADPAPCGRR